MYIGIPAWSEEGYYKIRETYLKKLYQVGTEPFLILPEHNLEKVFALISGVIIPGGGDIDPLIFGEEPRAGLRNYSAKKDFFEITIIKKAVKKGLPVLGICRGMQLISVAFGAKMYQDLASEKEGVLAHEQKAPGDEATHLVTLSPDGYLAKIFKSLKLRVNSFHHQAVKSPGQELRVEAVSSDGVIEAVSGSKILGVQWHPELLEDHEGLFYWLKRKGEDK